jgi:hypothetical protein
MWKKTIVCGIIAVLLPQAAWAAYPQDVISNQPVAQAGTVASTPVAKPVAPSAPEPKPAAPVAKPVAPVAKPVAPSAPAPKPAAPVAKPVAPSAPAPKPATPVAKSVAPSAPAPKPAAPVAKPVTKTEWLQHRSRWPLHQNLQRRLHP